MAMSHARRHVGSPLAFQASDGVFWQVREYAGDGANGNGGDPCLVFESDSTVRRIRTFPAGWRELSSEDLLAVSWRR
jgi:hypothetical protein